MRKCFLYVLLIVLISCNQGRKPFEKRIDKVFGTEVFRGLTIGDSYNKVLKTENKDFMQFPDTNIIKYMYHVSDTEEYHWAYIFEEDKVNQIWFDAYLGQETDGARYTELVRKKYDKILGTSDYEEGLITWQKDGICAALVDESPWVHMGKITLFIYSAADSSVNKQFPLRGTIE